VKIDILQISRGPAFKKRKLESPAFLGLCLLCLLCLLFPACQTSPDAKPNRLRKSSPVPMVTVTPLAPLSEAPRTKSQGSQPYHKSWVAGQSVLGRPIHVEQFGSTGPGILLLATIHGNESAGTPLLRRLITELKLSPQLYAGRRVVIVAVVNPDGFAAKSRKNGSGVDLNRNFPAGNFKKGKKNGRRPLTEPESQVIETLLKSTNPAQILSFHQAANMLDYDGPGKSLAQKLAAVSPLPVARMGSLPGSLGSYAGLDLKIPIVTVELPGKASRMTEETLWRNYGPMLLESLSLLHPQQRVEGDALVK
jgi:murein peptide amidase A